MPLISLKDAWFNTAIIITLYFKIINYIDIIYIKIKAKKRAGWNYLRVNFLYLTEIKPVLIGRQVPIGLPDFHVSCRQGHLCHCARLPF